MKERALAADGVMERLRMLFAAQFHAEVTDNDADLLASGLLDSLRLVELLLHIEDEFAVRVPLEAVELDDLRTLRRLAALVERRGLAQAPAPRAAGASG